MFCFYQVYISVLHLLIKYIWKVSFIFCALEQCMQNLDCLFSERFWQNSPVKSNGYHTFFQGSSLIKFSVYFLEIRCLSFLFLLRSILDKLCFARKLPISPGFYKYFACNCTKQSVTIFMNFLHNNSYFLLLLLHICAFSLFSLIKVNSSLSIFLTRIFILLIWFYYLTSFCLINFCFCLCYLLLCAFF